MFVPPSDGIEWETQDETDPTWEPTPDPYPEDDDQR